MSDKYSSLEHIIRNIAEGRFTPSDQPKINLEHAIREAVGVGGKDKPEGTPNAFLTRHYHSQGGNVGGRFAGNHTAAGKGVSAKQKQADSIKMESAPSDMSGITIATEDGKKKDVKEISDVGADTTPVASWPAAESGKKKIKEDSSVPYGTKERRKVVNVGRPDTAENPFDTKSKLVKQAEIS